MIPGFLAPRGPNIFFTETLASIFLPSCLFVVVMFTVVAPLVGVARKILAAGTKFSKMLMAGPLGGAVGWSGSGQHRSWRRQWQAP
jgi:hypothetical protein